MAIWNCWCGRSGESVNSEHAMRDWRIHYNSDHGPAIPIAEIYVDEPMPVASAAHDHVELPL